MADVALPLQRRRTRLTGMALLLVGATMLWLGATGWSSGGPRHGSSSWTAGDLGGFEWLWLPSASLAAPALDLRARWAVPSGTVEVRSLADPVAAPIRIRIPAIGVRAPLDPLGLDEEGALETPEDFARAGWWRDGPEPGEEGPAVIVGHVDSFSGPAVFFRLRDLRGGDVVHVDRADGTTTTFAVRSTMSVDKDRFPTNAVYGPTEGPELRLITCHGDFHEGSYDHNLVLFAVPAAVQ